MFCILYVYRPAGCRVASIAIVILCATATFSLIQARETLYSPGKYINGNKA